jgi:hypothetical protein
MYIFGRSAQPKPRCPISGSRFSGTVVLLPLPNVQAFTIVVDTLGESMSTTPPLEAQRLIE